MAGPLPDGGRGVYGISVAAELVGMGAQTLRLYDARGLVEPARTDGGTRRYSANDLGRPAPRGAPARRAPTAGTRYDTSGTCCRPDSTSPASPWSWTSKSRTPNSK